jgi:hypothetical protein
VTEMLPGLPLANFLDALGRRVTVEGTRSGLASILTRTPESGLLGGHPALDRDNARELGNALLAFADEGPRS